MDHVLLMVEKAWLRLARMSMDTTRNLRGTLIIVFSSQPCDLAPAYMSVYKSYVVVVVACGCMGAVDIDDYVPVEGLAVPLNSQHGSVVG